MPLYEIRHVETGEIEERFLSYDALQEFLKETPEFCRHYSTSARLDAANYGNVGTRQQPTDAFKTRLRKMSKFHKMDNTNNVVW